MSANRVSRRNVLAALAVPALLAACGSEAPPAHYEPLAWSYLPRLRLKVASIDIDDSWTPVSAGRDVGFLAPTPPVEALHRMAQDRLSAVGSQGTARFSIVDASVVQARGSYVGTFVVRLAILGADRAQQAYAEARVSRTRSIRDDSDAGVRAELYALVKQMMTDMNVEFEYQIRHSLKSYLLFTDAKAPPPGEIEQQNLAAPAPEAPAPAPAAAAPATPARPTAVPFSSPGPTLLAP